MEYEINDPSRYRTLLPATCPESTIDDIVSLLESAEFPVILAGSDILWARGGNDLKKLAETLKVPVATLRDSWGVFPGTHPLGVGMAAKGRGEAGNRTLQKADLILWNASSPSLPSCP